MVKTARSKKTRLKRLWGKGKETFSEKLPIVGKSWLDSTRMYETASSNPTMALKAYFATALIALFSLAACESAMNAASLSSHHRPTTQEFRLVE